MPAGDSAPAHHARAAHPPSNALVHRPPDQQVLPQDTLEAQPPEAASAPMQASSEPRVRGVCHARTPHGAHSPGNCCLAEQALFVHWLLCHCFRRLKVVIDTVLVLRRQAALLLVSQSVQLSFHVVNARDSVCCFADPLLQCPRLADDVMVPADFASLIDNVEAVADDIATIPGYISTKVMAIIVEANRQRDISAHLDKVGMLEGRLRQILNCKRVQLEHLRRCMRGRKACRTLGTCMDHYDQYIAARVHALRMVPESHGHTLH
jgi:hypothetical protein